RARRFGGRASGLVPRHARHPRQQRPRTVPLQQPRLLRRGFLRPGGFYAAQFRRRQPVGPADTRALLRQHTRTGRATLSGRLSYRLRGSALRAPPDLAWNQRQSGAYRAVAANAGCAAKSGRRGRLRCAGERRTRLRAPGESAEGAFAGGGVLGPPSEPLTTFLRQEFLEQPLDFAVTVRSVRPYG